MEFIPSIDLLDAKVVRLTQGDFARVTVYRDSAVDVAREFLQAGAERIHLVDLEGSRSGTTGALKAIEAIAKLGAKLQVGGGVRSRQDAERLFSAGVNRVVLGTLAVRDPELTQTLCQAHPHGIVVAVDAKDDRVRTDGWQQSSDLTPEALAERADGWGAAALLFTAIERDGMEQGPNVQRTQALQEQVACTVIASGGVGKLSHLSALVSAGVKSAISGRAIYKGAFTVEEALQVCESEPV